MNTYTCPVTRGTALLVLLLALCRTGMYATTDKQTETLRAKADMLHAQGKNDSAMTVAGKVLDTAVRRKDTDWSVIDDATALEIYRIAQEAVGNAIRHSGATRVDVDMRMETGRSVMTIKDNGRHAPHRQQGIGRRTMSQRAEAVGGSVEVSTGEDGTAVILTIPLKKDK